jgi:hypothetical protein
MKRRVLQRTLSVASSLLLIVACDRSEQVARSASGWTPIDSTVLEETDSEYVGRPVGLAVSEIGDLFVIDGFRPSVARFAGNGTFLGRIGRSGEGPGEFVAPTGLAFPNDSTVAVLDLRANQISLFTRESGRFIRRRPFEGSYRSISAGRDSLWLGLWNARLGTSIALWSVTDDTISHRLPLPSVYGPQDWRTMLLDRTIVVPISNALLVAFAGQESLLLTDPNGLVIDSLAVPVLRRRGIPDDVEERMRAEGTMEGAWRIASYLLAAERLVNGHVAIVHADMELKDRTFLMDVFVSLLSPDLKRACVDEPLPLTGEAQPWLAFRGDTLFALEQVTADSERVRTVVRRFVPNPTACSWRPVKRW